MNILMSSIISLVWGLLADISALTMLSLISITINGPALSICKILMGFAQLDILPSTEIFKSLFQFKGDD